MPASQDGESHSFWNFAALARPYFGAVLLTVALLTAGGIYSVTRMPRAVYPEVTFPRIAVVAKVPSLDVATMELKVTRPLEEAVSTVIGVEQVRSKTIRGGSELYIDFSPDTDMYRAEQFTWNHIGARRSDLPQDVDLTVERMTPSINPIISVVLTGGDNPSQLRDYAFYQLAPRIKNNVTDVLYANVAGGDIREIVVEARPEALLAIGLSASDLSDQIAKAHLLTPVGRIEHPPFAFQLLVNTQGETVRQFEELVVATKNSQPIHVRDVADVRMFHQDRVQSIGYAGRDAVVITIFRRLGGNAVTVSQELNALLDREGLKLPPGDPKKGQPRNVQATVVYNQAEFINTAVYNVRDAILIGGLFSILILLAFLRSWRATLISALAIPTTLAIALLFLYWSNATLNLMSLGGLAVAIGLIIDDTVVVVENIARHLAPARPGGEPLAATADPVGAASVEITGAVVGSTLTTVLVFVPLAFIAGVYGQFFASLSWALAVAVLVSMVISLTLVPVCAAKFLAGRPMPPPGPIYRFLEHLYDLGLSVALRFHWVTLGIAVAAVPVGILLYTGIPDPRPPEAKVQEGAAKAEAPQLRPPLVKGVETGLMPEMDEGTFVLDYWAPSGTPLARSEEMAQKLEEVLSKNPDVESYLRRTGTENGIFATQTNRGDITVVLRPAEVDLPNWLLKPVRPPFDKIEKQLNEKGGWERIRQQYRRRPVKKVMEEVEDEIKDNFSENQLKIETVQIMEDELNDLSGASKPLEVKLFGPDQATLRDLADKVGDLLEKKGKGHGIREVNSNVHGGNPDLMIRVDGVKAAHLGLTAEAVQRQLRTMFLGDVATQVRESAARILDVRVRYPNRVRFGRDYFEPDRLLRQWIILPDPTAGPGGPSSSPPGLAGPARAVPVAALARVEAKRTPDEQYRENLQPAFFVDAELNFEEAGLGSVARDVRGWMASVPMPSGYRWELGGHYRKQQEAGWSFFLVIVVAFLLVYIMLAFQFRSVVLPLLIFLTQPLSLVSGLFALWLTHTPLNVSSGMGFILLVGLDMKNGILLVEYIQQLRREGMALMPALLLAGRTRFRPILMTSLAAILGMLPLAFGIGPGAQMQQPLAIVVIGGLTANMLFTRMVIPVGYLVLEGHRDRPKPAPVPVPAKVV
jgi:multidrug efflux pump subunit AcrB